MADVGVFVAGVGEGFLDEGHVYLGGNLEIVLAVKDEDGASGFLDVGERVVVEEKAEPGRSEGAELLLESDRGEGGVHTGGFDEFEEFFVELGGILFFANKVVSFFVEGEAGDDLRLGEIAAASDEFGLFEERVLALGGGSGEQDEPGNVFGMRGDVGSDDGALAMADDADASWIDVLARFKKGDGGFGVGSKIERGGIVERTGGFGDAALVVAKNGNSLSSEVIGEDEKGLVIGEGVVAILRAGTGDEDSGGKRAGAFGESEGTGKSDVGGRVGEGDFFFAVGVRLSGSLRAAKLEGLIGASEGEIGVGAGLRPFTGEGIFGGVERTVVNTGHGGDFEVEGGFFQVDIDSREAADALIEAIERGNELAVGIVRNVKLEAQAHAMRFESSLPETLDGKDGVIWLMWRILATKGDREGGVALRPLAVDGFAVGREGAFEAGADGGNFEFESAAVEGGGSGFDGVDGLIETVEGGVEFAGGIFGEMENEVELGFASLESAGVDAFDWGRGGLGVGREYGGEEEGQNGDVKVARHDGSCKVLPISFSPAQKSLRAEAPSYRPGTMTALADPRRRV